MNRILIENLKLGESPIWDSRLSRLYWVDILDKKIYIKSNEIIKFIQMEECISYLGLTEFTTSKLVIGIESGLYLLNLKTEELELLSSFPDKNFRCNDGAIDNKGKLLIGRMNMGYNDGTIPFDFDGCLYLFENNKIEVLKENVSISNGITWSLDFTSVYYIDSLTKKILRYNYSENIKNFEDEELIYQFDEYFPDGMTTDNKGNLWVALYGGSRVICLDPIEKKIIDEIRLNHKNVTSCCFGGKELSKLFITCAEDENKSGAIYEIETEYKGLKENYFK